MAPRRITAAALSLVPLAALAITAPADAGTRWTYRSANDVASTEWIEYGSLPGVGGNVHVGFLEARTSSSGGEVFGKVTDYFCEPGEVPGGGGHGGHVAEPGTLEEEPACDFLGKRFLEAGDVTFTIDRKLTTARLTGTLVVDNHGSTARPPVDMTWTGFGETASYTTYERGTEDGYDFVYRYDSTSRDATVTGFIGGMGFTDDADDVSTGSIARTKSYKRTTSR